MTLNFPLTFNKFFFFCPVQDTSCYDYLIDDTADDFFFFCCASTSVAVSADEWNSE